jgi:simple sugar transport system permease protein
MLNAIAVILAGDLLNRYGQHVGNGVRSDVIPAGSWLGGWLPFAGPDGAIWSLAPLAVVVGVAFWVLLNKTRFGFDLRATGASPSAAVASGVNVNKMIVVSMLISGGVAGLIWMPAFFGSAHSYGTAFQAGLGFTGIAVALVGRNQPVGIAVGALLFAFLGEQSNQLTFQTDISVSVVQITQGVIVLTVVIAYEVVRRLRIRAEQSSVGASPPPSTPAEHEAVPV